ncbi:MAG: class I SAM-dependent methyltransferase, partial [Actinomycetota bacterium]|nr:class I SAM-dependent methyltransferase [Actinomycetota bacterium]
IPLAFYCLGVNHQVLVDIRRLVRDELVVDTARRLCDGVVPGLQRTPEAALVGRGLDRRLAAVGITYRAPCDARASGLESGSVDYITSTSTLEHIPAADIRLILRESRRLLSSEGRLSLLIDYQDHYSYADDTISVYNFLQFEDEAWTRWSPSLQYQSRLRHRDYLAMFDDEGFEVLDAEPHVGSDNDIEVLRSLGVASHFQRYGEQDLAIRGALITLRDGRHSLSYS